MIQLLALLIVQTSALANHAQYPATIQDIQCKELDFNSYHKVQNVKSNILRSNPERKRPNFAGKYLLLRNEFLFDTAWFVADCATGKFIKEILSTDHKKPQGNFRPESALLEISSGDENKKIPQEHHVFENEKWMKIQAPTPTPTPGITPSTTAVTAPDPEPEFKKFAVPLITECKPIDFKSNSRAESAKKNLMGNTPDLSQPNFAGHFLLLKGDTIFQTYWLIADCNTGKISSELITGSAYFEKDSRLFKIYSSGNAASYHVWNESDQQWISLKGKNSVYGKNAKTLFDSLPNQDKSTRVRFENLNYRLWDIDLVIKNGKCISDNGKYNCEIEL